MTRRSRKTFFWILLPMVLLLVISEVLSFEYMPRVGKFVAVGVALIGVLLLLATFDALRFGWAIRALGAAVFFVYVGYLFDELRLGHPFRFFEPRNVSSPGNALLGLIAFGIPGLFIALRPTKGRSLLQVMASARGIREGPEKVDFRGVEVVAGWPERLAAAQACTVYTVNGFAYPRIRFGSEGVKGWGEKPCLDCAALAGEFHVQACEYEKCPSCGRMFAEGCGCEIEELGRDAGAR
jgi:hypothetical protein